MQAKRKCDGCGNDRIIVNQRYVLCDECNYKRLHGRSRIEAYIEKNKSNAKSNSFIKKTAIKPKFKKATGELKLFLEIWEDESIPHICINCKASLGVEFNVWYFSHQTSKGANGKLRLEKSNIKYNCFDCHFAHEHQGIEAYNKRKDLYLNDRTP